MVTCDPPQKFIENCVRLRLSHQIPCIMCVKEAIVWRSRSITISHRSLLGEGLNLSLQVHRSISKLSNLTSSSYQAKAGRNEMLSPCCSLTTFQ